MPINKLSAIWVVQRSSGNSRWFLRDVCRSTGRNLRQMQWSLFCRGWGERKLMEMSCFPHHGEQRFRYCRRHALIYAYLIFAPLNLISLSLLFSYFYFVGKAIIVKSVLWHWKFQLEERKQFKFISPFDVPSSIIGLVIKTGIPSANPFLMTT